MMLGWWAIHHSHTLMNETAELLGFLQVVIVQNIAIVRLCALYGNNKVLYIFFLVLLACCDGSSICVVALQCVRSQGTSRYGYPSTMLNLTLQSSGTEAQFPEFHFCFTNAKLNILYLFW